jgi:hypothetical protein
MRARTITTIVVLGALAIPASAVANTGYATPNAITGASDDSGHDVRALTANGHDYSSLNATTPPVSEPSTDSGYSSLNATTGPTPDEPTVVSSPASGDEFDWGDAALGAGAAMALVAFGGAALLTVRRRTAISASAS